MRRKKLLKKILQLQFNKTIAEVGLALIAPIQGWKCNPITDQAIFSDSAAIVQAIFSDSAEMSRMMSPNMEDCPIVKYNDDDLEVALLNYT